MGELKEKRPDVILVDENTLWEEGHAAHAIESRGKPKELAFITENYHLLHRCGALIQRKRIRIYIRDGLENSRRRFTQNITLQKLKFTSMDDNSLLVVGLGEALFDCLPTLAISTIGNNALGRELQQELDRHWLNALLPHRSLRNRHRTGHAQ